MINDQIPNIKYSIVPYAAEDKISIHSDQYFAQFRCRMISYDRIQKIFMRVCIHNSSIVIFHALTKNSVILTFFEKIAFLEGISIFKNLKYDAKYKIY